MFCNIHKCHVLYPHSSLACTHVFCALFVLLCARISIYTWCTHAHAHGHARREVCVCVCVSASQINSVALEPKIYYQIKFLTEFIALSLAKHSSFAFRQHPSNNVPANPANPARTQQRPGQPIECRATCKSVQIRIRSPFSGKQVAQISFCVSLFLFALCCFFLCFVYKIYREQIWTICAHYFRVFRTFICC